MQKLRFGRRSFAVLGATALILAACGADEAEDTAAPTTDGETAAEAPAGLYDDCASQTGELVWAHEQEPPDMHLDDPSNNLTITAWIRAAMWEGLYGISEAGAYTPELLAGPATATENADGTVTIAYQLRDGLTWSDGTPLTSADVKHTYDVVMEGFDRETGEGGVYLVGSRLGIRDILPDSWDLASDTEFSFTMEAFFAGWPSLFTEVMPAHAIADATAANAQLPEWQLADGSGPLPSSGPMVFGEWNRGVSMGLVRNDAYHGGHPDNVDIKNKGVACVASVRINFVADTDAQINALKAGEADIIMTQPQLQFGEAFGDDPDFTLAASPGPVFEHWGLNTFGRHVSDPDVREALAYAMDKARVMEALYTPLFGEALPAEGLGNTYWLSNSPYYVDNAGNAGYGKGDIAAAAALLEADGYVKGADGIYEHPERGRLTLRVGTTGGNVLRELQQQILQEQLKEAGFEIVIENTPGAAYFGVPFGEDHIACVVSQGAEGNCETWEITQFAWVGGPWPGGQTGAYLTPQDAGTNNTYGYRNAEFDAFVSACDTIVDDEERAACYNEADAYVTTRTKDPNGLFMLPLTQKPSFYTYSNRRLEAGAIAPDANNAGPLVYVVDFKPVG
ncbi:MAG: ABC transporter substrate-binding protein [Nitriliruptoraceae bacterium]